MNTQNDSTLFPLDQQRSILQDSEALSALAVYEVLELAIFVTEKLGAMALDAEGDGEFQGAAELYDEIATAWLNAAGVLPADMQPYVQSLTEYWAERANEAHQQAALAEELPPAPERSHYRSPGKTTLRQAAKPIKKAPSTPNGRPTISRELPPIKGGEPGTGDKTSFPRFKKIDTRRLLNNQEDNDD